MSKQVQKELNGELDKEAVEVMTKQVEKGLSSDSQIVRVMINCLSEMLGELKKVAKNIENLNKAYVLANGRTILSNIGKRA